MSRRCPCGRDIHVQAVHTAPTSQFSPSNFVLMGIASEIATELQGSVNTDLIRRISKPK